MNNIKKHNVVVTDEVTTWVLSADDEIQLEAQLKALYEQEDHEDFCHRYFKLEECVEMKYTQEQYDEAKAESEAHRLNWDTTEAKKGDVEFDTLVEIDPMDACDEIEFVEEPDLVDVVYRKMKGDDIVGHYVVYTEGHDLDPVHC